jgi:Protein of unknown function (DUF2934)
VDLETRRRKQQALMLRVVERRVRERAQQLFLERGQEDGHALKDWVQAEAEVVGNTVMEPLYRRLKALQLQTEPAPDESPSGESWA